MAKTEEGKVDPSPKEDKAPRYRFAVIVWLAIYPAVTLLQYLLGPLMKDWPVPLKTLLISVLEVPYAVFFALPLLQKVFEGWLKHGTWEDS
ncbi:MAG: hypothetical protein WBA12_05755 [Catalinimonas sp.]